MRIMMKKQGTGQFRYYIDKDVLDVPEGQTVTFTITTENVPDGTLLQYNVTGISVEDLAQGSLSGTVAVTNGTAQLVYEFIMDQITEGVETMTFTLDGIGLTTEHIIRVSSSIDVIDISKTQTYEVTSSTSSVNEGQNVTFTVNTTNVPDGTLIPYNITGTGVNQADLSVGSMTGNMSITSNSSQVTIGISNDYLTEGTEVLTFTLSDLDISTNVTIVDTSVYQNIRGSIVFKTPGLNTWIAPAGVTSVSVVCVGGGGGPAHGGGGGGALAWTNNINVTPGQEYNLSVGAAGNSGWYTSESGTNGGTSYFLNTSTVRAGGGDGASRATNAPNAQGGTYTGQGGGNGGNGGRYSGAAGCGGAGAGGYSGNGGNGANYGGSSATAGSGGGGGGGTASPGSNSGGGGGVGLYGQGANGAGGISYTNNGAGKGGSSGANGTHYPSSRSNVAGSGGLYGGAAGGSDQENNGRGYSSAGAVRIVWGSGRLFPSSDVNTTENEIIV